MNKKYNIGDLMRYKAGSPRRWHYGFIEKMYDAVTTGGYNSPAVFLIRTTKGDILHTTLPEEGFERIALNHEK